MSWTSIGINFRASAIFVTDGAGETYCIGDSYPTTRGGATFGWLDALSDGTRDRDNTIDRRLAGLNAQDNSGTQVRFQLDLPASGSYTIRLAIGDAVFDSSYMYCRILDSTTPLFTIDDTNGLFAPNFDDANGTEWSATAWPSSNVARTGQVFSTTSLIVKIGSPTAQASRTEIAHLFVASEAVVTAKSLAATGVG